MDWTSLKSSIWPTAAAAGPDLYQDDDSTGPFYSSSTSTTPPTSQPPTPPHGSDGLTMQATSPINIATPTRNASSSPSSQGKKTANYHGVEDSRTSAMMSGSGLDPNGRTRQESFGGAKPISMNNPNPNRNAERPRRESLAGSLVGGMSWGGVSVGSWIRDE
jgi:transcription factor SFP1